MEYRPGGRPSAYRNGLGGYVQIFDRKYRLFGVINLIDVLVIVAVLVAGFAVYRVLSRGKAATSTSAEKDITYTVMCPSLRGVSTDQIKIGDTVYKTTGKAIGKVTGVRSSPVPGDTWDPTTMSIKQYKSTVFKDIFIDVAGKGTPTASGVAVADIFLHGNQPMPIMTSTFECDTANIATLTIVGQ
jgi:hypothetical protein